MYLPIADVTVNPAAVVLLGAAIGFLSGLFGVGGGFLATPMLNIMFHVPYNVAVGSDLAQILGTSVSGVAKHHGMGNVDVKLGSCMLLGGWIGLESGARVVEGLKGAEPVTIAGRTVAGLDLFVPIAFVLLLPTIATVMWRESKRAQKRAPRGGVVETSIANRLRSVRIPPLMQFASAAFPHISLWTLVGVGFATGFLSGFLGVGGGFVLMPTLIYVLGVPTTLAIGTDLFQIMLLASFGTLTHAIKGNVDLMLVTLLLAGSIFGARFGASLTGKVRAAKLRYWFSLIVYAVATAVLIKLVVLLVPASIANRG